MESEGSLLQLQVSATCPHQISQECYKISLSTNPPCIAARPATYLAVCPTTRLICVKASAELLHRAQPCLFSAALRVPSEYLNLKLLLSYAFKNVRIF